MIGPSKAGVSLALLGLSSALSGCDGLNTGIDTRYGAVNGQSVNGTGALYRLFESKGHSVRIARRYSDRVADWADTIVRFSPHPGPPDAKEADWLEGWLSADPDRRLIYVPHDFEAQQEYWADVIHALPANADAGRRKRMERELANASSWITRIPPKPTNPARKEDWFAVDESAKAATTCKALGGPWAAGVDAASAGISRRQSVAIEAETLLLSGDGKPLVADYTWTNGSRILIVANGSFLLNEPLAHRGRRALASRVVDWPGSQGRAIAFIEGKASTEQAKEARSILGILNVEPFGWIGGHLIALGLIGGLAAAVRIGRPKGDPPSGADRPVAHAEALGGLLSRTREPAAAIAELDAYRRWRHPSSQTPRTGAPRPQPTPPPTEIAPEGPR